MSEVNKKTTEELEKEIEKLKRKVEGLETGLIDLVDAFIEIKSKKERKGYLSALVLKLYRL